MIPILYEKTETAFISNGLGRLYDCIAFTITEERNGNYECEFSYPVGGVNFEQIQVGQIVAASINDSGDFQPFDIVSATKPINGVVTFYGTHISYRLNKVTTSGKNINSLTDALTMLRTGTPTNQFLFEADFTASGYMSAADGTPRTVRSMLGGVEGSILDTYGGEFEFDSWTVRLLKSRGSFRLNPIRYGLNLVDYNEELDASESFSGVVPFWKNDVALVKGAVVDSGETTLSGRTEIIPLDCSDKFENQPTTTQLENYARSYLSSNRPYLPKQTISLDFVNLADTFEYKDIAPLLNYKLCDTVPVVFPMYGTEAEFKIVKTVYDVLAERYTSMELGQRATTLSEALGIANGSGTSGGSGIVNIVYPVGAIYMSTNNVDPKTLFPGTTWRRISDRFLLASGTTYSIGTTGGAATVKLNDAQMAHGHGFTQPTVSGGGHSHTIKSYYRDAVSYASGTNARPYTKNDSLSTTAWAETSSEGTHTHTVSGGAVSNLSGASSTRTAHENMPPYLAVNVWERTS